MEITNEVPMGKLNDPFVLGTTVLGTTTSETTAKFLLHPITLGNVGQTTPHQYFAGSPSSCAGPPSNIILLVGPEGSFTDQEVDFALRNGFVPLDLGKRILRTETACIAAAALFLIGSSEIRSSEIRSSE
jgi:16S rRNA U1498 N3-methylase RsmE